VGERDEPGFLFLKGKILGSDPRKGIGTQENKKTSFGLEVSVI
jgi:hypothetical protein